MGQSLSESFMHCVCAIRSPLLSYLFILHPRYDMHIEKHHTISVTCYESHGGLSDLSHSGAELCPLDDEVHGEHGHLSPNFRFKLRFQRQQTKFQGYINWKAILYYSVNFSEHNASSENSLLLPSNWHSNLTFVAYFVGAFHFRDLSNNLHALSHSQSRYITL